MAAAPGTTRIRPATVVPRGLGTCLRDAWRLCLPYFRSEERQTAWALLAGVVALELLTVALDVVLNAWTGSFYDALQDRDWTAFLQLLLLFRRDGNGVLGIMPGFCVVVSVYVLADTYSTYLGQWLRIRWRRWLTGQFLDRWLDGHAHYHVELLNTPERPGVDNPDQRIADDLRGFVDDTLSLGLDLMSNLVSLLSFLGILWSLSGSVSVLGIRIPGTMVWAAAIYALAGSVLVHLIGRPLALLSFRQQSREADFRFALVRLRENAEAVALHGGEAAEKRELRRRFDALASNWWSVMARTKALTVLTAGYDQLADVFPLVVAAPRFFAGAIALGGLTRTASAFGEVQSSLSWLVSSYASIAAWRATVERLAALERAVADAQAAAEKGVRVGHGTGGALELRDVSLGLPDGSTLLEIGGLTVPAGSVALLGGRSGSGKSILLRAVAGIWPFGSGTIERPRGRMLFLPQRPYLPAGTLRRAVTYPDDAATFGDHAIRSALADAGLEALRDVLDQRATWEQRLSPGEQQRLAIARAMLLRPDWLFLDAAVSDLGPEAACDLVEQLRKSLPDTTIVSVDHLQTWPRCDDPMNLVLAPDY